MREWKVKVTGIMYPAYLIRQGGVGEKRSNRGGWKNSHLLFPSLLITSLLSQNTCYSPQETAVGKPLQFFHGFCKDLLIPQESFKP